MSVFPSSLDSFPTIVDNVNDVVAAHPNNRGSAIVALEAKTGVDNSAVSSSLDYLMKSALSVNPGHKHPESKITFSTVGGHDHDGSNSKLISLFSSGDFLLTANSGAKSGWTDRTSTYASRYIRIGATALDTGGTATHTHTGPSHTHGPGSYHISRAYWGSAGSSQLTATADAVAGASTAGGTGITGATSNAPLYIDTRIYQKN